MDINIAGFPSNLVAQKVTINTTGNSEMIATQGMALVGIFMPASWTAAALGYKVGWNGKDLNMQVMESGGGTPVTTVADADTFVPFPMPDAAFVPFLQINSVTVNTATLVTQGAARELILLFRKYLN